MSDNENRTECEVWKAVMFLPLSMYRILDATYHLKRHLSTPSLRIYILGIIGSELIFDDANIPGGYASKSTNIICTHVP